jgi:hypothetical protein
MDSKLTVRLYTFSLSLALLPRSDYDLLVTRGFLITNIDAPQSVESSWTSAKLVAGTSTWQHSTHTNIHAPGGNFILYIYFSSSTYKVEQITLIIEWNSMIMRLAKCVDRSSTCALSIAEFVGLISITTVRLINTSRPRQGRLQHTQMFPIRL